MDLRRAASYAKREEEDKVAPSAIRLPVPETLAGSGLTVWPPPPPPPTTPDLTHRSHQDGHNKAESSSVIRLLTWCWVFTPESWIEPPHPTPPSMLWPRLQGARSHTPEWQQRICNQRGLSHKRSGAFSRISEGSFAPLGADEDVCWRNWRSVVSEIRFGSGWGHAEQTRRKVQELTCSSVDYTQHNHTSPTSHSPSKKGFQEIKTCF